MVLISHYSLRSFQTLLPSLSIGIGKDNENEMQNRAFLCASKANKKCKTKAAPAQLLGKLGSHGNSIATDSYTNLWRWKRARNAPSSLLMNGMGMGVERGKEESQESVSRLTWKLQRRMSRQISSFILAQAVFQASSDLVSHA